MKVTRKTIFRLRRVRQGYPINLTGFLGKLRQLFQHVQSQDRARVHVHIREGCRSHPPTVRQRRRRLPTSRIFALAVLDGKLVAPKKTSFATESMKQRTASHVTGRPTRPHKGQVTLRPKVRLPSGQRSRYLRGKGLATSARWAACLPSTPSFPSFSVGSCSLPSAVVEYRPQ